MQGGEELVNDALWLANFVLPESWEFDDKSQHVLRGFTPDTWAGEIGRDAGRLLVGWLGIGALGKVGKAGRLLESGIAGVAGKAGAATSKAVSGAAGALGRTAPKGVQGVATAVASNAIKGGLGDALAQDRQQEDIERYYEEVRNQAGPVNVTLQEYLEDTATESDLLNKLEQFGGGVLGSAIGEVGIRALMKGFKHTKGKWKEYKKEEARQKAAEKGEPDTEVLEKLRQEATEEAKKTFKEATARAVETLSLIHI